jgi:hypothetical protein
MSHHVRYAIPVLPFVFVLTGGFVGGLQRDDWKAAACAAALLGWSAASSLWVYPHSLSYFNELAGGPWNGYAHLANSNVEWGQDMLYLKRWLDAHPEAAPLGLLDDFLFCGPDVLGIAHTGVPPGPVPGVRLTADQLNRLGPQPGWFAVSVNWIPSQGNRYKYFLRFKPVATAGYSIYVYRISPEEANRVRRELCLPELP